MRLKLINFDTHTPHKARYLAAFIVLFIFCSASIVRAQEPLPAAIRFATPTEAPKSQNLNTPPPSVQGIMDKFSPEQRAQIQQIADQVAAKMRKKHGDDPDKIQSELQQYMGNPAAFYKELSPDQKNKVKEIGDGVLKQESH